MCKKQQGEEHKDALGNQGMIMKISYGKDIIAKKITPFAKKGVFFYSFSFSIIKYTKQTMGYR